MAKELKNRKDMDARWQWRVSDIMEGDAAFEAEFVRLKEEIKAFAAFAGKVKEDPKLAIRSYFFLMQRLETLYSYAGLSHDQDTSDANYQALSSRAESLFTEAQSAAAFLEPELLLLPAETLGALQSDPDMRDYDAYLRKVIRMKPHMLSTDMETLLASAGDVLNAPSNIFGMFNNVDLPLPEIKDEQGDTVKLTHGNYGEFIRSRDRDVRKAAFEGVHGTFEKFGDTVTAMYAASVKGDLFTAKARKFPSARAASLYHSEIPEKVYDSLIDAVSQSLPVLADYMKLRKEKMGLDELHLYDLYVPIVGDFDMKMTYSEAFELVLEGLKPLGEDYLSVLRDAYKGGWIDVYENKAKRSGAYSWDCYGVHPFVLLNHTDDLSGAMTLAHELGHAMHSWHSEQALPYSKAGYSLFVAEVASTCNEVLLMRHLMNKFADNKAALSYLNNQLLEEFRTTVFRQTMFAEFEKESHALAERGEALTKDALNAIYYALNEKYYGAGCVVDEVIKNEWMRIPHFYRNFYVYQYATGFSAAVAIATRILNEGESAVRDYKKFLSAGGSVPPIEALRYAGVDMENPETVESALRVFADCAEQLKKLLK